MIDDDVNRRLMEAGADDCESFPIDPEPVAEGPQEHAVEAEPEFVRVNGNGKPHSKTSPKSNSTPKLAIHIHDRPYPDGRYLVEAQLGESAPWYSDTIDPHNSKQQLAFSIGAKRLRPEALWTPSETSDGWLVDHIKAEAAKLQKPDVKHVSQVAANPDAEPEGWRVELTTPPDQRKQQLAQFYFDGKLIDTDRVDPQAGWQRDATCRRLKDKIPREQQTTLAEDLDAAFADAVKRWEKKRLRSVTPLVVRMNDVTPRPIEWIWKNKIARGKLTLCVGDPGCNKSFLTCYIAGRCSTGKPWPDGSGNAPLGDVLFLNAEDDIADTVRMRLDSCAADVNRIAALQGVQYFDGTEIAQRQFDIKRDLPALEMALDSLPNCVLVIIDPISAFQGGTDSHKNAEMRATLAPLGELAARRNVAILAVSHMNKGGEGSNPLYRPMGSLATIAMARSAFLVAIDPKNRKRRLMVPLKSNIAEDNTGLAFTLETHISAPGWPPYLLFEPEPVEITAAELLNSKPKKGPDPTDRTAAEDYLREALKDGPKPTKQIEIDAKEKHCIKQRTLERARMSLGIVAYQVEPGAPWWLRLPTHAPHQTATTNQDTQLLGGLGTPGVFEVPSDEELAARPPSKSATVTETAKNAKNAKNAKKKHQTAKNAKNATLPKARGKKDGSNRTPK